MLKALSVPNGELTVISLLFQHCQGRLTARKEPVELHQELDVDIVGLGSLPVRVLHVVSIKTEISSACQSFRKAGVAIDGLRLFSDCGPIPPFESDALRDEY